MKPNNLNCKFRNALGIAALSPTYTNYTGSQNLLINHGIRRPQNDMCKTSNSLSTASLAVTLVSVFTEKVYNTPHEQYFHF